MTERIDIQFSKLFIDGKWVNPVKEGKIDCIDPSTGDVWGTVAEGTEEDIDRAVEAANEAFENGPWRSMTGSQRARLLRKLASLVEQNAERLAQVETRDAGIHIRDSRNYVQGLADALYYYAGLADKIEGTTIPVHPDLHAYTVREPVGVVGAITPWNAPILMYSWKLAPALAAGNTVVLKPAEQTPASALELANLIDQAGFPAGVVNIVPGFGKSAGAHLVSHPKVNKIAFTGETSTGVAIMKSAAETMKRITFELGGKAPNIIFDDADLEKAIPVVVNASFLAAGQSCSLGSRLFVHTKIYDRFMDRYLARAEQVKAGDPFDMSIQIGPQASEEQVAKTMRYIEIGEKEGAKIALGGTRPSNLNKGYFVEPTVFTEVEPSMRIAQEEIFGPVVSVIRFEDEQDLIKKANGVMYGLSSAVWTQDISRAHRVARELKAGTVWVNTYRKLHYMLPYGGFKMSGQGRENGLEVMNHYTEVKVVVVDLSTDINDPWA